VARRWHLHHDGCNIFTKKETQITITLSWRPYHLTCCCHLTSLSVSVSQCVSAEDESRMRSSHPIALLASQLLAPPPPPTAGTPLPALGYHHSLPDAFVLPVTAVGCCSSPNRPGFVRNSAMSWISALCAALAVACVASRSSLFPVHHSIYAPCCFAQA
jgi:hypothetical protein